MTDVARTSDVALTQAPQRPAIHVQRRELHALRPSFASQDLNLTDSKCLEFETMLEKLSRHRDNVKSLRERLEQIEGLLAAQGTIPNAGTSAGQPEASSNSQQLVTSAEVQAQHNETQRSSSRPIESEAIQQSLIAYPEPTTAPMSGTPPNACFEAAVDLSEPGQTPIPNDLPPISEAWILLQEYLSDLNEAHPLFNKDSIVNLYRSVYAEGAQPSISEVAAVHTTIGIAHRLRAMSPLGTPADDELAQAFFTRASAALPQMLTQHPTLLTAQCLSGLAVVLEGTTNPEPAVALFTAALRMVMDLFYLARTEPVSQEEYEQLKRVYWISSQVELNFNIRRGRWYPATFAEVGIPLPEPVPADQLGQIRLEHQLFHIFHRRAQLVQMQARLVQAMFLYQTCLQQQPQVEELMAVIADDLKKWRKAEPLFWEDPEILSRALHRSDLIHTVILEASYFNSLFALRAFRAGAIPVKGSVLTNLEVYDRMNPGECINDARRLLRLFEHLPKGNYACIWLIIEGVVSALYVVLNVIVQRSSTETQQADLGLTVKPVAVITGLVPFDTQGDLGIAAEIISSLYEAAKTSCGKRNNAALSTGKASRNSQAETLTGPDVDLEHPIHAPRPVGFSTTDSSTNEISTASLRQYFYTQFSAPHPNCDHFMATGRNP